MRRLLTTHRWLYCLLAAAMLAAQSFTQAHATEFGEHEHSHDGHQCIVALYTDRYDDDALSPDLDVTDVTHAWLGIAETSVQRADTAEAITARPRAPPFLN